MPPRIAIPIPTSFDLNYNRRSWPAYAEAIRTHGAEPVEIPLDLTPTSLAALVATCDAILLPGSPADVSPARYGQEVDEASSPPDLPREITDLILLEHASAAKKPILGVCFGCQILNVFHGGTLIQDLGTLPVNHPSARGVIAAHTAAIAPSSLLGSILDPTEAPETGGFLRLPVNSSHHQAVGITGEGLRISARCPQDAVVEAIEGLAPAEHFVLGIQWHPERTTECSATSRLIFARLVDEATRWFTTRSA
jgi:putative glutamine amidotransferase